MGDICIVEVSPDAMSLNQKVRHQLDYGVLSVKREHDNTYSVGASDGTVKLLSLSDDCTTSQTYGDAHKDVDGKVCLMHDSNKQFMASVTSEGSLELFDKETA